MQRGKGREEEKWKASRVKDRKGEKMIRGRRGREKQRREEKEEKRA